MELSKIITRGDNRPLKEKFNVPWYFSTWYDKLFLLILLLLSIYAVVRAIMQGVW